jgi:hypothetical protein
MVWANSKSLDRLITSVSEISGSYDGRYKNYIHGGYGVE